MAESGRTTTPVILAGLTFGGLAAILLPLGRAFGSSSTFALGMEAAFDAAFYLIGGTASQALRRSQRHALWCYTRETVELMALGSGVVFVIGALLQPSTSSGAGQAVSGVGGAAIAIGLAWFWHPKLDEHGHTGFDSHMIADAVLAATVAASSITAVISGNPGSSFWGAMLGAVIALSLNARAAGRIIARIWHRPNAHPHEALDDHHHLHP